MKEPIIIKNILPGRLFSSLQDDTLFMTFNSSTYMGPRFWGVPGVKKTVIPNIDMVTSYVKLRMLRYSDYHLSLHEVKINGATAGLAGGVFHPDIVGGDTGSFLSLVLYISPHWNTQWGGETVIQKPDGEYFYSSYIPNNGVMFPSTWQHYGASPNAHCNELRKSIGFVFKQCYNSPVRKKPTL